VENIVYIINFEDDDLSFFIENKKNYEKGELQELIKIIKFELSHHVNTMDIINILSKDHGFKVIEQVSI